MFCTNLKSCTFKTSTGVSFFSDGVIFPAITTNNKCPGCQNTISHCNICGDKIYGHALGHFYNYHSNGELNGGNVFNNAYINIYVHDIAISVYSPDILVYIPGFLMSYCKSGYASLVEKIYNKDDIFSIYRISGVLNSTNVKFDELISLLKQQTYFCILCKEEYDSFVAEQQCKGSPDVSKEVNASHLNKCVIRCRIILE